MATKFIIFRLNCRRWAPYLARIQTTTLVFRSMGYINLMLTTQIAFEFDFGLVGTSFTFIIPDGTTHK